MKNFIGTGSRVVTLRIDTAFVGLFFLPLTGAPADKN